VTLRQRRADVRAGFLWIVLLLIAISIFKSAPLTQRGGAPHSRNLWLRVQKRSEVVLLGGALIFLGVVPCTNAEYTERT
jgi:hypothetical protein